MNDTSWIFRDHYEFKIVETFKDDPHFTELSDSLLSPPAWNKLFTEEEQNHHNRLNELSKALIHFKLGVYYQSKLIAYTSAFQGDSLNLHMARSCVHPDHQRKGIYSELLRAVLDFSKKSGFQMVDSYHRMTNNPVLIAKLRTGFIIDGIKVSDIMGSLVHLTYFHHPERKKLIDMRAGNTRPNGKLKELFF